MKIIKLWFSSPSGAFYFSIKHEDEQRRIFEVFVPFRGFLFFYRTLGDYWNCGGKVTPEALEELRGQCNKYYIFDLDSFEVLERREIK